MVKLILDKHNISNKVFKSNHFQYIYNDYVYDVELSKNHVLWIRYKGKTCFSGNCECMFIYEKPKKKK